MIGPRLNSLFKSRWSALLWAAMVVWSAISFVGFGGSGVQQDGKASPEQGLSKEDSAAIKGALEGQ